MRHEEDQHALQPAVRRRDEEVGFASGTRVTHGGFSTSAAGMTPDTEEEQTGLPLSHYLWILQNKWWQILAFVAIVTGATAAITLRLTPIYEGTATLYIDRSEARAVVGQEANMMALPDTEGFVRSQIELVQSDAVLRPVVNRYQLVKPKEGEKAEEFARRKNAPVKLRDLRVQRRGATFLLAVQYRDPDPELAANVANGVARSYIDRNYELRAKTSENTARFLESQLDEVRAKMERSTEAFTAVEQRMSGVNPDEKTSVLSERLSQLNNQFSQAQGARLKAEAAMESTAGGDAGSILGSFDSAEAAEYKRLQERQNEADEQLAQLETTLGPKHPDVRRQGARKRELARQIEDMRTKLVRQKQVTFRRLKQEEDKVAEKLAEAKREYDGLNSAKSEYTRAKRDAEQDRLIYEEMVKRIREATINSGFQSNQIRLAGEARPEMLPVFPSLSLNLGLALLASLLAGCATAIAMDQADPTVRDPESLRRILGVTTVGVLPRVEASPALPIGTALELAADSGKLLAGSESRPRFQGLQGANLLPGESNNGRPGRGLTEFDESVRTLREALLANDLDGKLRTMMVTSPNPSEGKSTVAAHLAVSMAEQGRRTLLVECDLRRPSQQRYFGEAAGIGLTDAMTGELRWSDVKRRVRPELELDLIQAGRASRRAVDRLMMTFPDMLDEMAREYQLVIVDAPPLLGFPESMRMGRMVDGVLLVAEAGGTDRRALASCVSSLRQMRAELLGFVLNGMSRRHGGSYYYYRSYYGKYGYGKRAKYYAQEQNAAG